MSFGNFEHGSLRDVVLEQVRVNHETRTLTGNITLIKESPTIQMLDPDGARTVTLPAEADSDGLIFMISNEADAAEIITVEDDGTNTIVTPTQNEAAIVWCNGVTWSGLVGATA